MGNFKTKNKSNQFKKVTVNDDGTCYTLHVMFASNYEVQHKPKEWTFYIQYYEKQLSNLIYTQHEKWKKTGTKQFKKLR
jgi:hypothetical protein